jgi:hypothetical protein
MDYTEARAEIDAAETEWREWESTASSVVAVLEQARDALDAEMTLAAVMDALTALRMADWSSPKAMNLLQEDMTTIENALDEIKCNLENEETVPEDELPPPDGADHSAESYLRGAIDAYRARNVGDAIEHAANAIRRMTRS